MSAVNEAMAFLIANDSALFTFFRQHPEAIESVIGLATEQERERCARICDKYAKALDYSGNEYVRSNDCQTAANVIRRGG